MQPCRCVREGILCPHKELFDQIVSRLPKSQYVVGNCKSTQLQLIFNVGETYFAKVENYKHHKINDFVLIVVSKKHEKWADIFNQDNNDPGVGMFGDIVIDKPKTKQYAKVVL